MYNQDVSLSHLLKEQMAIMARRPLLNFASCVSYSLSCIGRLTAQSFMPWSSPTWTIAMHPTRGYSRKISRNLSWYKMRLRVRSWPPRLPTPLLCKLHWMPICFWVQFKVLVVTFKALHDIGPSYLRDHIHPIILVHSTSQVGSFSAVSPHSLSHTHTVEHSPPRS